MNDSTFATIIFSIGIAVGVGSSFLTIRGDMIAQDKIIAKLEAELKIKPIITVDTLGMCQINQGGKSYLLVDVTEELKDVNLVEDIGYRVTDQEIEAKE